MNKPRPQLPGMVPVTYLSPAKGRCLSYLTPTLYLFIFHCGPLPGFIVTHSPLVCPSFTWTTDSYTTCYLLARGLFIDVMVEAVNISETSVYYKETTRRYIQESSNLNLNDVKSVTNIHNINPFLIALP
jgi:hypothetical protein